MTTLIKVGHVIINLANVTEARRNGDELKVYFNVAGSEGLPDYAKFDGDKAERLFAILNGLCQFEV